MPKSLKVHSGERIDIVDFVQGANTYTQETQKHLLERSWIDRRGRILDGFRVRIEDQSLNPGLITVYNGNAVDRSGQLINNEDSPNDSRSITLLGVSTTFYVEIEFTSVESDTDARFFWDPTVPNTPPEPDGSEFALNVATRISPDWKVLVNTVGFQQSTNPNSVRVPVCILTTDGTNQVATGVNPGLTLVQPASVLESDIALGVNSLRVIDARIMPTAPFSVTIDVGGALSENRIVTAVDRVNGILTISVATANAHQAGSIVRATTGNVYLVADNRDPSSTSPHPDPAQRVWQANELRGSALTQSKETFGVRDDLNLRSLKDEIDFLSAQLREMKFGHPRPDVVSTAPPVLFATRPRYFDRAGSIQGAKTNTVSIGNGTTTFGDFNGTDDTPFNNAVNALPVTGGTIFVKAGTYNFAKPLTLGKPVRIVGVHANAVNLVNDFALGPLFYVSANAQMDNLTLSIGTGLDLTLDVITSVFVSFTNCVVAGTVRLSGAIAPSIRAYKCAFSAATLGTGIIASTGGAVLTFSEFISCSFVNAVGWVLGTPCNNVHFKSCLLASVATLVTSGASDTVTDLTFGQCNVTVTATMLFSTGNQVFSRVRVTDNQISSLNLSANQAICLFSSAVGVSEFAFNNNYVTISGVTGTDAANPGSVVSTVANTSIRDVRVEGNYVTFPVPAVPGTNWSVLYVSDATNTQSSDVFIRNNKAFRSNSLVRFGSIATNSAGGNYVIEGNYHDNAGATATAVGIEFFNGGSLPVLDHVAISRNSFLRYNNGALAGSRIGVLCTFGFAAGGTVVSIDGNYFDDFGPGAAPTRSAAIDFGTIATANTGAVKVTNNKIRSIYSAGADCFGINLAPANLTHSIEFQVDGNSITDLGGGTVNNVSGVYLSFIASASVIGNYISTLVTPTPTAYATCVALENCGVVPVLRAGILIKNNRLSLAAGAPGAPNPYWGTNVYAFGGTVSNTIISNNAMSQRGLTSGAQTNILVASDALSNVSISENILQSADSNVSYGISLGWATPYSASAVVQNVKVCDNLLDMWSTTGIWTSVFVAVGTGNTAGNAVIANNTIIERFNGSSNNGITVIGHNTPAVPSWPRNISVLGNNLIGGKTGVATGKDGITILTCEAVIVADNNIDWLEFILAQGTGIRLLSTGAGPGVGRQYSIVGNLIRSDASPLTYEIYIDASIITSGNLQANIVGDAAGVGQIFPMPAAGNWQYGLNTSDPNYGTNKFD